MLVAYEDYKNLGYSRVSEEQFPRYEALATAYAMRMTSNRIVKNNSVWDKNLIGLCELIDAQYAKVNQEDKVIMSFSNGSYSETYASVEPSRIRVPEDSLTEIMDLFFTSEQRSRRVIT